MYTGRPRIWDWVREACVVADCHVTLIIFRTPGDWMWTVTHGDGLLRFPDRCAPLVEARLWPAREWLERFHGYDMREWGD